MSTILILSVQSCLFEVTKEIGTRCKSLQVANRNYERSALHLSHISYLPFSAELLFREHFITFSITSSKLRHALPEISYTLSSLGIIFFSLSLANYSRENFCRTTSYRARSLAARRSRFHGQLNRILVAGPSLIFIPQVTPENERPSTELLYFSVAMRGRIPGWPPAPPPQIAPTDAVTRIG